MKDNQITMRLQRFLAQCGIASRRKCEQYISEGRIQVNGETINILGTKVSLDDAVMFDGNPVKLETRMRYVALYKPKGYLCAASDTFLRPLAVDLLKDYYTERLYSIGRLDLNSSGLILFTNDGTFAGIVSHPSSCIEKEYIVESREPVTKSMLEEFKHGVTIDEIRYRIADFRIPFERRVHITLIEGKNREIRRLYESKGLHVSRIHRFRIGPVHLRSLKPGEHRDLNVYEKKTLLNSDRGRAK